MCPPSLRSTSISTLNTLTGTIDEIKIYDVIDSISKDYLFKWMNHNNKCSSKDHT